MRRGFIAITVTALLAATVVAAGSATAVQPTPAQPIAGAATDKGNVPFQGAGLEELLASLVSGDSPLITEVPPSQPFSPFGQDAVDDTGESTIIDEFELIINPRHFAITTDLDLDGTDDITTENGERDAASPTLVRVEGTNGDGTANELWGDMWRVFDDQQIPTFGGTFANSVDELLTGLGLDLSSDQPQDALGTQVTVARPMNPSSALSNGAITIWGAHTSGTYGSGAACNNSMYIYEFGRAFLRDGRTGFQQVDRAPKDLFAGISDAIVIRCPGSGWYIDSLGLNGSGFNTTATSTTALIFSNGYLAFTNSSEFATDIGYRSFHFRTPASGGYQPGNTIATTYPLFPTLMTPRPQVVVGTPYPRIEYGPFPLRLDFTASTYASGSDEELACSADWSALFEAYLFEGSTPDVMDVSLYQFASGQFTLGKLTYSGSDFSLTTSGGGEGFEESFSLNSSGGDYSFNPGELACIYTVAISRGLPEYVTAIDNLFGDLVPPTSGPEVSIPEDSTPEDSVPDDSVPEDSTSKDDSNNRPVTTEDDSGFPWGLTALISGLVLLAGGYGVTRTRKNGEPTEGPTTTTATTATTGSPVSGTTAPSGEGPCERIRRMHEEAKADAESKRTAADDASTAADDAETKADDARSDSDDANDSADSAKGDRQDAERRRNAPPPSEEEAWIQDSDTGERITGTDLRLRREAAGEAFDRYQDDPSQESAEQTESDWKDLDAEGARAGRRAEWEADQAKRAADLNEAQDAENAANDAKKEADEAADEAEQAAKDARADADQLDADATDAEANAAELKRMLDECLGLSSGSPTHWGGPVGLAEDPSGGCFPEGNVERRVLDTFDKTVKVNWWVTVRPSSSGAQEARRISGELRWWRDVFATASAAVNVAGAVKGLTTRTIGDAVGTAASGATVLAGDESALGIDIPTVLPQVPIVILEGAAATSAALVDKWGDWIESNHVEMIAEFGFQVKDVKMTWVEIWKCTNGVKTCVERVLEIDMGPIRTTGSVRTETFQPREPWQARVDGLGRTIARQAQTSSQEMVTFMGKYTAGSC